MLFSGVLFANQRGVTEEVPTFPVVGVRKANIAKPSEVYHKLPQRFIEEKLWYIVPAGEYSTVKFNHTDGRLENLPPDIGIASDSVFLAIERAPKWMRLELLDGIRRLESKKQLIFARKILNTDPLYRDEIAFQVAHLAPKTLNSIDPAVLDTNVAQLYRVAPDLQYVDIVEYGDPMTGDWYTTTKYRIIDRNDDTTWMEIPKEIYYWYVMMPKLNADEPKMDNSVYNRFWRDYLYNYSDPGYPLLKDVLKDVKVFWDGKYHIWPSDRELSKTMMAVDAVGWWDAHNLPDDPGTKQRFLQPNQIIHHHYGRCGENQDLLNAASRTALMPVLSVSLFPQDHVWCEIYWDGEWYEYQVDNHGGATRICDSTTSYDGPDRQTSVVFANRADWYTWSVTPHYTPVCTLTVKVEDKNGNPVDGAELALFNPPYWNPSQTMIAHWVYTDIDGKYTMVIGDSNNYYLRLDCPIGHIPRGSGVEKILDKDETSPGRHFELTYKLDKEVSSYKPNPQPDTFEGPYKVKVIYNVPYRILYGHGYRPWTLLYFDDYEFGDFRSPGDIDFFVCDEEGYNKHKRGTYFKAYQYRGNSSADSLEFLLPGDEDIYLVFSNKKYLTTSQLLQFTIYLYKKIEPGEWVVIDSLGAEKEEGIEVARVVAPISLKASPNPTTSHLEISYSLSYLEDIEIAIYDAIGRKVITLFKGTSKPGNYRILWDGRDDANEGVRSGVYFLKLDTERYSVIKKAVVIGK